MTCAFCLVVFEEFDAQYVSHLLSEHPEAQFGAAVAFGLVPLFVKHRVAQFMAYSGIAAMGFLYVRRSFR
jgi:hypothetical protein